MEIPDELLTPDMIAAIDGKEPLMLAIISRDPQTHDLHPHVAIANDAIDDEHGLRAQMAAGVQQLVFEIGYPDLSIEQQFSLHLVRLEEAYNGSYVLGLTNGLPFGTPVAFLQAMASVLQGVGDKLGVNMAITDGEGLQNAFAAHHGGGTFRDHTGHAHHATPPETSDGNGAYL